MTRLEAIRRGTLKCIGGMRLYAVVLAMPLTLAACDNGQEQQQARTAGPAAAQEQISATTGEAPASAEPAAGDGSPDGRNASTLDEVRARGYLRCGVSEGLLGFSIADAEGNWSGLDVDFCRALAAAIFDDPQKVEFTPLSAQDRFTALQSGAIDVLSRNTTWTMTRDAGHGLSFVGVIYYDGQGFMVRRNLGVTSAKELSGASICTQTGTTTELNLADYFRANQMEYGTVAFEGAEETLEAYTAGHCDVFTSDVSQLYARKLELPNPDEHVVLPEVISEEPLGPAVRQGDSQWYDLVEWTLFALINAEELGVTSDNVDQMMASDDPEIRRLLGQEGSFGEYVGLESDWAANAVRAVGNYGQMFARNVGENSEIGIERGLNRLWTEGGIMYAPPIR